MSKKISNNKKNHDVRRDKVCAWCKQPFVDSSKRLSQRTCCIKCSREWGVATRKENGSYKRTKEQNEKMVVSLSKARAEGRWKISEKKKEKLSKQLKERWESGKMSEDGKKTCLKKYGVEHQMKSDIVKQNLRKAFMEKYGVDWATKSQEVKDKTKNTRIKNGLTYQFQEKTMKEWAGENGISYSYFKQMCNEKGFEFARKLSPTKTIIEVLVEEILHEICGSEEILYDNTMFKVYRPDFIVSNANLIIECDGLAWHSDRINKDKKYHLNKKIFYQNNGYRSLFFRSDEIKNNLPIVKSIITNSLGKNIKKVYARSLTKTSISAAFAKTFFEENHLMGNGRGRTYALCDGDKIMCAIQVKWKNISSKTLEISRFCGITNTSVVGGYSRLIKMAEQQENPKTIITFVDERYGSGKYLKEFGFKKLRSNVSFQWTDGVKTFHRMKFRGNDGYEKGLYKIWDCGQTLFIKENI